MQPAPRALILSLVVAYAVERITQNMLPFLVKSCKPAIYISNAKEIKNAVEKCIKFLISDTSLLFNFFF